MSFEGFEQLICANNHHYTIDVMEFDHDGKCPSCGAEAMWHNMVDQTNGSFDEDGITRIDGYIELEILNPGKFCTCACGNVHEVEARTTFKVPETGGTKGKYVIGYGGVDMPTYDIDDTLCTGCNTNPCDCHDELISNTGSLR